MRWRVGITSLLVAVGACVLAVAVAGSAIAPGGRGVRPRGLRPRRQGAPASLSDGEDAVVADATAARFGATGLYYSYEGAYPWRGRIRFVPFDKLRLR